MPARFCLLPIPFVLITITILAFPIYADEQKASHPYLVFMQAGQILQQAENAGEAAGSIRLISAAEKLLKRPTFDPKARLLLEEVGNDIEELKYCRLQGLPFEDRSGFISALEGKTAGTFYRHVIEARTINKQRREVYARLSSGKSKSVSNLLIHLESLTLLFARYIDWKAAKFNKRGIPIIENEFVSMEHILPIETRPAFRNRSSHYLKNKVKSLLKRFQRRIKKELSRFDFHAAAGRTYRVLQKLKEVEDKGQCHFAMTRHILESIGLAALHAIHYVKISRGETRKLSSLFIKMHLLSLKGGLRLDRKAQKIHKLGIGILVNDLPFIPFEKEWENK
ncbi:hypothetical protein ACFL35_21065 [Candidatus Riflebacteria bacterium]